MLIELNVCSDVFCHLNMAISQIKNHNITHQNPAQNNYVEFNNIQVLIVK